MKNNTDVVEITIIM